MNRLLYSVPVFFFFKTDVVCCFMFAQGARVLLISVFPIIFSVEPKGTFMSDYNPGTTTHCIVCMFLLSLAMSCLSVIKNT